jgi:hypothetical protein
MATDRNDSVDSSQPLTSGQRATLDIVLDMIVPPSADGRMPGAAEVGVPAYLLAEAPDALPALCRELEELGRRSRERYAREFAELEPRERQSLVGEMRSSGFTLNRRSARDGSIDGRMPARSSARAQASDVAPDVRTSSIKMSLRPLTASLLSGGTRKAP